MTKSIPLTKGKVALVDDDDYEWLNQWKWTFLSSGYAYRKSARPNPKTILMHRLITGATTQEVDHINGDRLDNRRSNLRLCSRVENASNKGLHPNNTTGYKGVFLDKRDNVYQAYINHKNKRISLGRFKTAREAALRYNQEAVKLHGIFASLNKVE